MEINGEVNIEIDQYADVSIEIDTDDLAETLCQDHNLVDDVVLREYVREQMENELDDRVTEAVHQETQELRVNVAHAQAEFEGELQDLSDQVKGLISPEPDSDYSYVRTHVMDNYVRINDLREVIDAQIDLRVAGILNDVMKGIEEKRQENQ
jgi:hypothetical protein